MRSWQPRVPAFAELTLAPGTSGADQYLAGQEFDLVSFDETFEHEQNDAVRCRIHVNLHVIPVRGSVEKVGLVDGESAWAESSCE
jgi:hypothetical protein